MMRRAARVHSVVVSLAVGTSLAAAPPEPLACPPDAREKVAEARQIGERAQTAFDGGAFVDAAEGHARAVRVYPECDAVHLRRLTALEQAVAIYRDLHAGKPERIGFLEKAVALIDEYLADLRGRYGELASEREGFVRAATLRAELDATIAATARPTPAPEPVRPAPTPPPARDTRPLKLGIGVSAGVAGVALAASLGMLIAVRRDGPLWRDILERTNTLREPSTDDAHMCADPTDSELQDLCGRRTGLVAGSIVAGVIFLAGVSTAAALGWRLSRESGSGPARARLSPLLAPGRATALAGLRLDF